MSSHPAIELHARHVDPTFVKLLGVLGYGRVFVRAEDVWVGDDQGRRYLDLLAGFGAANLGHNHPRLLSRLERQLRSGEPNLLHTGPSPLAAELGKELARRCPEPLSVCLFANSGAEAVEAAMKLARLATGRRGFVSCTGGFHGTSPGTLSLAGDRRLRGPFGPLLPDCQQVPFGDLPALARALRARPAAFVVEPILGEGGAVLPPAGWLAAARQLCRDSGALLVLDEVQTGVGRTGRFLSCEHEQVVPDVVVLAKALGGGLLALGAAVTSPELFARAYGPMDRFDLHGSTFAGNALACAAGLETLAALDELGLTRNAEAMGERLLLGLRERLRGHPLVREVRGRGLLVGVELGATGSGVLDRVAPSLVDGVARQVLGQWVAVRLLERGFIVQPASRDWRVLKLTPPLTIQASEVDAAIAAIGDALEEVRSIPPAVLEVLARVAKQVRAGYPLG